MLWKDSAFDINRSIIDIWGLHIKTLYYMKMPLLAPNGATKPQGGLHELV